MKVEFDVASMQHGARRATALGTAVAGSGRRVGGLPIPEGTPPEIAGELRSAASSLNGAARSLSSQSTWLNAQAQLAVLADSPLGSIVWKFSPPLLSPFKPLNIAVKPLRKPKNPWGPDFLHDAAHTVGTVPNNVYMFGKGFTLKAGSAVVDITKLAGVLSALPYTPGGYLLPKNDPRRKWRNEYAQGVVWAYKNPKEFAKAIGATVYAGEEHKKYGTAGGLGANTFDIASMFFGVGEIAAAARGSRAFAKATKLAPAHQRAGTEARTAREASDNLHRRNDPAPRPGESNAEFRLRERSHQIENSTARGRAESAERIHRELEQRYLRARAEAAAAQTELEQAMAKTPRELARDQAIGTGLNTLTEPAKHSEAQQRAEAREQARAGRPR